MRKIWKKCEIFGKIPSTARTPDHSSHFLKTVKNLEKWGFKNRVFYLHSRRYTRRLRFLEKCKNFVFHKIFYKIFKISKWVIRAPPENTIKILWVKKKLQKTSKNTQPTHRGSTRETWSPLPRRMPATPQNAFWKLWVYTPSQNFGIFGPIKTERWKKIFNFFVKIFIFSKSHGRKMPSPLRNFWPLAFLKIL